jgi:hypothetical protein
VAGLLERYGEGLDTSYKFDAEHKRNSLTITLAKGWRVFENCSLHIKPSEVQELWTKVYTMEIPSDCTSYTIHIGPKAWPVSALVLLLLEIRKRIPMEKPILLRLDPEDLKRNTLFRMLDGKNILFE